MFGLENFIVFEISNNKNSFVPKGKLHSRWQYEMWLFYWKWNEMKWKSRTQEIHRERESWFYNMLDLQYIFNRIFHPILWKVFRIKLFYLNNFWKFSFSELKLNTILVFLVQLKLLKCVYFRTYEQLWDTIFVRKKNFGYFCIFYIQISFVFLSTVHKQKLCFRRSCNVKSYSSSWKCIAEITNLTTWTVVTLILFIY